MRDGELADTGSWVYVWISARGRGVVYVGATGLPPAMRTWLHLHDEDPAVGRVAARYPGARQEDLDVLAFRVPDARPRAEVKAALIHRLSVAGLLVDAYAGDPSGPVDGPPDAADDWLDRVVRRVRRHAIR